MCLCVSLCIYAIVSVCVFPCVHLYMFVCLCVYECLGMSEYLCMFMCMFLSVFVYFCVCAHVCMCVGAYMYFCVCVCMPVWLCFSNACVSVSVCACVCVCMHFCMYPCVHMCLCVSVCAYTSAVSESPDGCAFCSFLSSNCQSSEGWTPGLWALGSEEKSSSWYRSLPGGILTAKRRKIEVSKLGVKGRIFQRKRDLGMFESRKGEGSGEGHLEMLEGSMERAWVGEA